MKENYKICLAKLFGKDVDKVSDLKSYKNHHSQYLLTITSKLLFYMCPTHAEELLENCSKPIKKQFQKYFLAQSLGSAYCWLIEVSKRSQQSGNFSTLLLYCKKAHIQKLYLMKKSDVRLKYNIISIFSLVFSGQFSSGKVLKNGKWSHFEPPPPLNGKCDSCFVTPSLVSSFSYQSPQCFLDWEHHKDFFSISKIIFKMKEIFTLQSQFYKLIVLLCSADWDVPVHRRYVDEACYYIQLYCQW